MAENGTITETPHSFGILTDYSRRLMLTSAVDIERLVSTDIMLSIATELDRVAINGDPDGLTDEGSLANDSSGSESVILLHRTRMSAFEANSRSVGRHFPAMGGHRIQL